MEKINLDKTEFIDYFLTHSRKETAKHFKIGTTTVGRISRRFNVCKKSDKLNDLLNSKEEVIELYLSCRTIEECCKILNVSRETFCRFLSKIDYHKPTNLVHNSIWMAKNENKTFNSSSTEDNFYNFLNSVYGKNNVFRNYNLDDRYPFHCDFYIKTLDLFIELNLFISHGSRPFDENSLDDLKLLAEYSQSDNWIEFRKSKIWGGSDREKINVAKQNNLNYIIIYPHRGKVTKYLDVYKLSKRGEWVTNYKVSEFKNIIGEDV